jgi:hypothetical protein
VGLGVDTVSLVGFLRGFILGSARGSDEGFFGGGADGAEVLDIREVIGNKIEKFFHFPGARCHQNATAEP